MRNHSLSLVNAYYLGQLIDVATTSSAQRTLQMATLMKHYYRIAIRFSKYQALLLKTLDISAGAKILSG
ncbi:11466_t:CDS:2, partial [Funneliformis geosporum]